MADNSARDKSSQTSTKDDFQVHAPAINLPKGGGAIHGIGEKFAANPVTGTGSMSVPIATSPGRSGFGPQLSLAYDSGAGNGPFGFGWNLSLPSISRKTDKGLPQYLDAMESDIFILSGSEDLVPAFEKDAAGNWVMANGRHVFHEKPREIDGITYAVRRYRPRTEGLFARIERWTRDDGDVHWRSISKDNILTIYGKDSNARIVDPEDSKRIFSWLICETRDDKGNAVHYEYKPEDGTGIDLAQAHERNRGERDDKHRTANRYLKRIKYGNRVSFLDGVGQRPPQLSQAQIESAGWMFEVVFDYDDHDPKSPKPMDDETKDTAGVLKYPWKPRQDPFSTYRAGFEVRTYRLCQRVLMFHHFPDEADVGANCLVRSTDFTYSYEQNPNDARNPVYTFLGAVTQSGYKRSTTGYLKRSLPPLEFTYTAPTVQDTVETADAESLANLPMGVDGSVYQWTDLHGEGIPGILTEQGGAWFYKRNLSPIGKHPVAFAPLERVDIKPNLALASGAEFMDLAGDGQPDVAVLDGPMPGFYEHDDAEGWQPFRPFISRLNRDMRDPNLKFIDLNGDGHADVLITEDDAFVWHASLAEEGFGPALRVAQALDEEKGPRLIFADSTQSIYLADLSGDGLTDLVRLRNGEVCYWPNLGYCRFGAKVTMDNAPWFDNPDQFNHRRIRLADIDGSGTTDIIYLHGDGVRLYFNQSGNSWSQPQILSVFPHIDDLVSIVPTDLLGNGTACLVWSSALPGDAQRPMRYVNLMGEKKPHLLEKVVNNLGVETLIEYASSIKFYLQDKRDGKPWVTRLPFPVHVVERVEICDWIGRNRFATGYAYHHGYFDGEEREFRGFGLVEQWDTEQFAALSLSEHLPQCDNIDKASHVPPVHTRTWFHTGAFLEGGRISKQFENEYYREGDPSLGETGLNEAQRQALLLKDTILPQGDLAPDEIREACRALKGAILRQEIYARDGTEEEDRPYSVSERNYTIKVVQARGRNEHAVFFTHPRETIDFHYERKLRDVDSAGKKIKMGDPRTSHTMTLAVDDFGNTLRSVAIGYGRRAFPEVQESEKKETHITLTASRFANRADEKDWYRVGLPIETRTYEVVNAPDPALIGPVVAPFGFTTLQELFEGNPAAVPPVAGLFLSTEIEPGGINLWPYEKWDWRRNPAHAPPENRLRLIEHLRTLYRPDDMGSIQNDPLALLPLGQIDSLALAGETYQLAFTPGLLAQVFQRPLDAIQSPGAPPPETLLPTPAEILPVDAAAGKAADRGCYVDLEGDGCWWIPSGRVFHSPDSSDSAALELAHARQHFFLPRRYRDPFHTLALSTETVVAYDAYDLFMTQTADPAGNTLQAHNDYRMLQPDRITDPNRNRTQVAFDALGMVAGTAVMGKVEENLGDSLAGFETDLTQAQIDGFYDIDDPHGPAPTLLKSATTRIIYDLDRFQKTRQVHPDDPTAWLPAYAATLARETHESDPLPPEGLKIQISFSYSDGFGREIQQKIQAEPGALVDGGPLVTPRWVGSGWTVFNNKGKPVRQYEPFFSQLSEKRHRFEFGVKVGVSPVVFYDPLERVVATLHPNHTFEKVVSDPWVQTTYDANDTVAARNNQTGDPRTDPDIAGVVSAYFKTQPASWQTWYQQRIAGAQGAHEQTAAGKAAAHADTPTAAHFDSLGRVFLTVAHNRVVCPNHGLDGTEETYPTRVVLDIEGNQRAVIDAKGRVVMRYNYSMAGPEENEEKAAANHIHQASMEAGERWMLSDVAGNPIRAWDSRGFTRRMAYDALRRPIGLYVTENGVERLAEQTVYGEGQGDAGNHRARVYQVRDGAGIVTSTAYDFKGNLLESRRDLLPIAVAKRGVDWQQNPIANDGGFTSQTNYDALNRPRTVTSPDGSVYRPTFNAANLLDRVAVNLRGAATLTPFVSNIDYNAKGQRVSITYGNDATTTYGYDPLTFRLIQLSTTRPAGPNGLVSQLFQNLAVVQDLNYTYDPAGNIIRIEDAALKTVFHNNQQIDPVATYTYDALYRLVEAKGREHIGQTAFDLPPTNGNRRDHPFTGLADFIAHPNDIQQLRNYTERYQYDAVGNFETLRHTAENGSWTRTYFCEEESLIEAGVKNNRLTRTTLGNGLNHTETYGYTDAQGGDVHGCMTAINSMKMGWDFEDQLRHVDLLGGGTAYYIYDAGGERVRKVIETQNGTLLKERIYLGGFEVYREYNGNVGSVKLARESLHIMDDNQRIALVETKIIDASEPPGFVPKPFIRYQIGNNLGSASVELNEKAQVISYEEYSPYGSTVYQAVDKNMKAAAKRYRYTGKERDEESGLNYHAARYYAPWLGMWTSCDPKDVITQIRNAMRDEEALGSDSKDKLLKPNSLYEYAFSNPVRFWDPNGKRPKSKLPIILYTTIGLPVELPWEKVTPEGQVNPQKLKVNWTDKGAEGAEELKKAFVEAAKSANKPKAAEMIRKAVFMRAPTNPREFLALVRRIGPRLSVIYAHGRGISQIAVGKGTVTKTEISKAIGVDHIEHVFLGSCWGEMARNPGEMAYSYRLFETNVGVKFDKKQLPLPSLKWRWVGKGEAPNVPLRPHTPTIPE